MPILMEDQYFLNAANTYELRMAQVNFLYGLADFFSHIVRSKSVTRGQSNLAKATSNECAVPILYNRQNFPQFPLPHIMRIGTPA